MKTLINIFDFCSTTVKGLFAIAGGKIFIDALLSGTVLFVLYPRIHHLFPLAAVSGVIPYYLNWVDSVCIVWIVALLFKGNTTVINQTPSLFSGLGDLGLKGFKVKTVESEEDIEDLTKDIKNDFEKSKEDDKN